MKKKLPEFLAILVMALPVFRATNAAASEIKVTRPSNVAFEISGGSEQTPWHIRYGTSQTPRTPIITLSGPGSTAYFTHVNWLRRVDTDKGEVTGRWRFPGATITALKLNGDRVQVEVDDRTSSFRGYKRVVDFDPNHPEIPSWSTTSLNALSTSRTEMSCYCSAANVTPADAERFLPEAENAVKRDPLSPWLRVALAHVYQALGKPEANQLIEEAINTESTDFTELLRLSSELDAERRPDAARKAFDRGYEDFWKKGYDPRLMFALLMRIVTYSVPRNLPDELRPEIVERGYKVAPWVERGDVAWEAYSESLRQSGNAQEAQKWHDRAQEAAANSLFATNATIGKYFSVVAMLVPAALFAAVLFVVVTGLRYVPERKIQSRADSQAGRRRRWTSFNVEYWSRSDRIVFLTILAVLWISTGFLFSFISFILQQATMPLGAASGTFAGASTIAHLEELPPSPERDLLVAMAYQQDGQPQKAEALYRQLPQFAESWNNLGVLLKDSGKEQEARQAFERALQLDPQSAEAKLNLGNPPSNLWTEAHQRYLPERAMFIPPRRERMVHALGFGSAAQLIPRALLGPIFAAGDFARYSSLATLRPPKPVVALLAILVPILLIAFIISLTKPLRDVTQPAPRYFAVLEFLLPGIAAGWRYAGGFVLLAWAFGAVQLWLYTIGARIFPYDDPSLMRSFGVVPVGDAAKRIDPARPMLEVGIAIVVVLYAINTVLVWKSRRQSLSS